MLIIRLYQALVKKFPGKYEQRLRFLEIKYIIGNKAEICKGYKKENSQ